MNQQELDKTAELVLVLLAYNAAADKFLAKVDAGNARSVETYRDLKIAREAARKVVGQ